MGLKTNRWFLLGLIALLGTIIGCDLSTASQGEKLYGKHCQNCHGGQGEGLQKLIPPLAGADFLAESPEKIACIIRYGMQGAVVVNGTEYDQAMPANPKLDEIEIINIINYIQSAWGNDLGYRSPEKVTEDLKACQGQLSADQSR